MSSNVATYGSSYGLVSDETQTGLQTDSFVREPGKVKVIKTGIVLEYSSVNEKSSSIISLGFKYYPYSISACIALITLSVASLVTFFTGLHSQLILPIWVLLIGLGMFRTLVIAGTERTDNESIKGL